MAMTGAMSAAIAGMKTHMQALSVVGNNIANVNTYGYKTQRITFKDSLYSTLSAGSAATDTAGGLNPQQLGYGCGVGTIDLNMATGDLSPTGMATDCAIQGDGFFLVGAKGKTFNNMEDVKGLELTRVGNFEFRDGYLVDKMSGNVVYGLISRDANNVALTLQPIRLPLKKGDGSADYTTPPGNNTEFIDYESLSIDANGKITCTNASSATGEPVVVGYIALAKVDNPSGLLHKDGPYYRAGEAAGDISLFVPNSAVTGQVANADLLTGSETGLMTSFLEGSGTDLATEFSNMIIYQRGYQANTRIISVTDSMLEELVNIKR
ncbi:MAG: flagellar hook-basal body complex protein [Candidatus Faecalibacterium intestinavium]|uniref:Flagellar hook protein FlgE n=1 Tax=Candidatus Faecalibacterium intestinavium TaxID=2838580 RepID=A0A9E2KLD5_9FIRM|nr:flagellar hook-basal body complex protein [Candidatus Faecalibacterium intestinavium]